MFPKVNQPQPSCLLPRANSIQTLVFLLTSKPLFQPPLSQGLLWYKIYIYSKSIPRKIGTNLSPKICFCYIFCWQIWVLILPIQPSIFHVPTGWKTSAKFGPRTAPFGPRFWHIQNSNFESLSQQNDCYYDTNMDYLEEGDNGVKVILVFMYRNMLKSRASIGKTSIISPKENSQSNRSSFGSTGTALWHRENPF